MTDDIQGFHANIATRYPKMMAKLAASEAVKPVSPSEILREEFGHIWPEGERIGPDDALELSRHLGPSPGFFLNLQKLWDEARGEGLE